jgi:sulfatase maturation enzyme AslB (radical SAM superfamily)
VTEPNIFYQIGPQSQAIKHLRSESYNYDLDTKNGTFLRWGKTYEDDPQRSPYGPEILDCEITTKCSGNCPYCYKKNLADGINMDFERFQKVVQKINKYRVLTQVAFGLGARGDENPDLWKMCKWLRSEGIMPNGTIASGTPETWDLISKYFGACAVSYHGNFKNAFGVLTQNVYELSTLRGMGQVNVHFVVYQEVLPELHEMIHRMKTDPMLRDMNAIVLLGLKEKGRAVGQGFHPLTQDQFDETIRLLMDAGVRFGMDSCEGPKFLKTIKSWLERGELTQEEYRSLEQRVEPCESFSCFSSYVNVEGVYYPCSFCEGIGQGFHVLETRDFIRDVWNGRYMMELHERSVANERSCIYFNV